MSNQCRRLDHVSHRMTAANLAKQCRAGVVLPLMMALSAPLFAQQPVIQGAPSVAPELDAETAARLEAQRNLTTALARIAADSSDFFALSQAGRAALVLGDARAALGFLGRAEALSPQDPVIKAAIAAAFVGLEDPAQAMRYFDAAVAAGGLDRTYLGDRGLAFDMLGDQARAQADYVVAIAANPSAELTRRYAISLGISGEADRAVQLLGPLLRAQDRAAWRSRAMIVAMNGRADEAREIARATMPRQLADGLEPYFGLMDQLTPAQLAAASHFGRFPSYDVVRNQPSRTASRVVLATATPVSVPTPRPNREHGGSSRTARDSGRAARRAVVATATPATLEPAPVVVRAAPSPGVPAITMAPPPPPPPAPTLISAPVVQVLAQQNNPATDAPEPVTVPPAAPVRMAAAPALTTAAGNSAVSAAASPAPTFSTPGLIGPPNTAPAGNLILRNTAPQIADAIATVASINAASAAPQPAAIPSLMSLELQPSVVADQPDPAQPEPSPSPAPAPATVVVAGWSLDTMVASIEVPESERAASAGALTIDEVQAIAAEQRQ